MCSSWYHLRYLSPQYDQGPFDPEEYDYWMPVDAYTGGVEHATMHLIYTRFFHKALRDLGIVKGDEPMLQLRNQGIILGEDREKMSKSRGNVVAPDPIVAQYGADTLRAYLMFGYRWADGGPWSADNIEGVARWLNRVWHVTQPTEVQKVAVESDAKVLRRITHQTIKKVTNDLEAYEFNTIIAALMTMTNGFTNCAKRRKARRNGTRRSTRCCCSWRPSPRTSPRSCGCGAATRTPSTSRRGRPTMRQRRRKS